MSKIKIKKSDVVWSYIGQGLNIGANIVLLPMTLNALSTETYGVWQIFVSLYLFFNLLDFGFRPTFLRNVAYVYGGATSLIKKGVDASSSVLPEPNFPLLKSLALAIKKFYGLMSVVVFFIAITIGSYYIYNISESLPDQQNIMYAWLFYVIAISFSFYLLYHNTLLNGCGYVKECNQVLVLSKIVYVGTSVLLLYLNMGLMSVGLGMLLSSIVNYISVKYFISSSGIARKLKNLLSENLDLLKIIGHNALRVGIVNISLFFTTRGILFLAPIFLSLDIVAQYGLTLQIIGILTLMGQLYFQTNIPLISQYRIENNFDSIKKILSETYAIYYVLYGTGAIFLILFGNTFLSLMGSNTLFLDTVPLICLLIVYFLDMNHNIAIQSISTKNIVPYLWPCIINGIAIVGLTALLLCYTKLGIYSLIFSVGFLQVLYQNWKWPLEACKELNVPYVQLLELGFTSIFKKIKTFT